MMTFILKFKTGIVLPLTIMWLILPTLLSCASETLAEKTEPLPFIDTSAHLHGTLPRGQSDYQGAATNAVKEMDKAGISRTILLPPPFTKNHRSIYDEETLRPVAEKRPDRFSFMAGGGSLNPMLIKAAQSLEVSEALKKEFIETANKIASSGAVAFGEISLEHFGLGPDHQYEYVPADHPLMMILADIAAEKNIPVFVHLEAIEHEAPIAGKYASFGNPKVLRPNIHAFEKLLAHNRNARFVWGQLGWDHTGQRTPELMERLFSDHPNLFAAIKIGPDSLPETRPLSKGQGLKPAWNQLIEKFSDRIMMGGDQFYTAPGSSQRFIKRLKPLRDFLDLLPGDLAAKVAYENADRVYGLKP